MDEVGGETRRGVLHHVNSTGSYCLGLDVMVWPRPLGRVVLAAICLALCAVCMWVEQGGRHSDW